MINVDNRQDLNGIESSEVAAALLEIGTNPIIRLVRDNKIWNWGGAEWLPFPFDIDRIDTSGNGEIQQVTVKVSNVSGDILKAISQLQGNINIPVVLRTVRENQTNPDQLISMQLNTVSYDQDWITFVLGARISYTRSYPSTNYKNVCQWEYKGWRCRYSGSLTTCNKTYKDCKAHDNVCRFGGFKNE